MLVCVGGVTGLCSSRWQCLRANFIKGVSIMTRSFFARVLAAGGAVTRRYLYMVQKETNGLTRIVRYPRTRSGDCWIVYDEDPGYVCAVYAR